MLSVIKNRRSYRDWLDKEVEPEKLEEILKAAQFAPSARNLRLWEFIVVKDKKTKELLAQTKPNSWFANKAPVVIVIVSKDDGQTNYWLEDGSISATCIYLETENQGLGTCFIQVYNSRREDGTSAEEYVKKILKIPEDVHVLCLMPLGYPKSKLSPHKQEEFLKNKIHREKY